MRCVAKLTAVLAAVIVAGWAGGADAQQKKIIRAVPIGDLKVLDPIWSTAYTSRNHGYMVWDTLFALDANNKPQPQMVDRYTVSNDGLVYTFVLREGLLWHDNTPVTAADCVASIRRWGAKDGMGRALMDVTDALETVDARTFRLRLKQPVGFVIEALGKIDSNVPFMMPERIAKTDPNTQITEVIGSGPFRFVKDEWVPGSKVVYEKFEGYKPRPESASQAAGGKVVKVDRVEMVYLPDPAVAANAIVKGEIDLLASLSTDLIPFLQTSKDVIVTPNDPLGYQLFMVVNHLQPPFDKPEARRALLHGIKQSDFLASVDADPQHWRECAAVFGCGAPNESKAGTEQFSYDLNAAKTLLKQANYDGRPLVVMDPTDNPTLHPPALVAADALKKLGANVDLQAMDWSTLTQRRASKAPTSEGGWNVFITNATITGIENPLLHIYVRNCDQAWYGWACDPKIPELTRAWGSESDPTKRRQIIDELQRLHLTDVTYVPLGQYRNVIAYRKGMKGLIASPALFFWNIEKE
jgi:peptide/nickel transport system substrate-binding protein